MKEISTKLYFLVGLLIISNFLFAQNGIVSIQPAEAMQGTSFSATILLNSDAQPPLPPENQQPSAVKIGDIEATNINRSDETTITCDFQISAGITTGSYDVVVEFDVATYTLSGGFMITGDGSSTIIYVDAANGSDGNDGLSWGNAKQTISSAIDEEAEEVWVAKGTYRPTSGSDRSISIVLNQGLKLYGGFAGSESQLAERTNFGHGEANETIISGDIGTADLMTDNSYHLMKTAKNCVVDGFSFMHAYANGELEERLGGAIYLEKEVATINNCYFSSNYAEAGAAIYIMNINGADESTRDIVEITNCEFVDNEANLGGAIVFRVGASSNITNCKFENNDAEWRGGAIFIDYGAYEDAQITISDCDFINNNTTGNGGAIYADDMASQLQGTYFTVRNNVFTNNTATYRGGAISIYNSNNFPTIESNTFTSNTGSAGGNAIAGDDGPSLTINNNTLNADQDIDLSNVTSCNGSDCPK